MLKFFVSRTFFTKVLPALGLYTLAVYVICLLAFWVQFAVLWLLPMVLVGLVAFGIYSQIKGTPIVGKVFAMLSGKMEVRQPDMLDFTAVTPENKENMKKAILKNIEDFQDAYKKLCNS